MPTKYSDVNNSSLGRCSLTYKWYFMKNATRSVCKSRAFRGQLQDATKALYACLCRTQDIKMCMQGSRFDKINDFLLLDQEHS